MISHNIEVKTPFGTLVAYPSTDPSHPGIGIDLKVADEVIDLALVEFSGDDAENEEHITSYIWGDADHEDYTARVIHEGLKFRVRFSEEMVRIGIENGLVSFVPNQPGYGTMAAIGGHRFYLGSALAEDALPAEYLANTPFEEVVREVTEALNDLDRAGFSDECSYYYSILTGI